MEMSSSFLSYQAIPNALDIPSFDGRIFYECKDLKISKMNMCICAEIRILESQISELNHSNSNMLDIDRKSVV